MAKPQRDYLAIIVDGFAELCYGLWITAGSALAGVMLGGLFFYFSDGAAWTLTLMLVLGLVGLAAGLIWAIHIHVKKGGTTNFIANLYASPDLDRLPEREKRERALQDDAAKED